MSKIGEVRVPNDQDFENIRNLCQSDQDWTLENKSSTFRVWTKKSELSDFKMIRAQIEYDNVSADLLYDVIQDGEYRAEWDDRMYEGYEICTVSPYSVIEYYALKFPKPFKNRDFVTQRCWLDYGPGRDKIVFNHSVNHAKCPPKKGMVRGVSYITATYIRANSPKSCTFWYVTQSDPGSSLPPWIINTTTKIFAPKLFKKLTKSLYKYEKWKAKHNANYRPWANPEQMRMPRINWADILPLDGVSKSDVDESNISEKDLEKIEDVDDEQ